MYGTSGSGYGSQCRRIVRKPSVYILCSDSSGQRYIRDFCRVGLHYYGVQPTRRQTRGGYLYRYGVYPIEPTFIEAFISNLTISECYIAVVAVVFHIVENYSLMQHFFVIGAAHIIERSDRHKCTFICLIGHITYLEYSRAVTLSIEQEIEFESVEWYSEIGQYQILRFGVGKLYSLAINSVIRLRFYYTRTCAVSRYFVPTLGYGIDSYRFKLFQEVYSTRLRRTIRLELSNIRPSAEYSGRANSPYPHFVLSIGRKSGYYDIAIGNSYRCKSRWVGNGHIVGKCILPCCLWLSGIEYYFCFGCLNIPYREIHRRCTSVCIYSHIVYIIFRTVSIFIFKSESQIFLCCRYGIGHYYRIILPAAYRSIYILNSHKSTRIGNVRHYSHFKRRGYGRIQTSQPKSYFLSCQ